MIMLDDEAQAAAELAYCLISRYGIERAPMIAAIEAALEAVRGK